MLAHITVNANLALSRRRLWLNMTTATPALLTRGGKPTLEKKGTTTLEIIDMPKKTAIIVRYDATGKPQFYAGGNLAPWADESPMAMQFTHRTAIHVATTKNLGPCAVVENYGYENETSVSIAPRKEDK